MSDDFQVNNPAVTTANEELNAAVGVAGTILDELNGHLARMATATQNSGLPLWADLQNQWNQAYDDMIVRLEAGHRASVDAHDWYLGGDLHSVRIMS